MCEAGKTPEQQQLERIEKAQELIRGALQQLKVASDNYYEQANLTRAIRQAEKADEVLERRWKRLKREMK